MHKQLVISLLLLSSLFGANASAMTMQHNGMTMDEQGMIMNENKDNLPKDCPKISQEINLTIHAGTKHAKQYPGKMFAFDQHEWEVPGCSKINLTLINDDHIRHQLMIHGLPGYLYTDGMFTIEIYGPGQKTASLIVPGDAKTYMMHCEVPQHMEKGMKAQLKVAGGNGDLPSIPGLTDPITMDSYAVNWTRQTWVILLAAIIAGFASLWGVQYVWRKKNG